MRKYPMTNDNNKAGDIINDLVILQLKAIFEDREICFPFAAQNSVMSTINKLAIFCGSKKGNNSLYEQHAKVLAAILAEKKVELIYGGGKSGLMGVVADTVMQLGGIVRGVIPKILTEWEHQHDSISELMVVDDMHLPLHEK